MPVVTTTVIAISRLKNLAERFGFSNWGKRESATPMPEDWVSHSHQKAHRADMATYGLRMTDSELKWIFENVQIPVARKWETKFGGRREVKAGSKQARIVLNAGPLARNIYFAKLRIAGRHLAGPASAAVTSGRVYQSWKFPTEPGSGINELGEKVSIRESEALAIKMQESNSREISIDNSGNMVFKDAQQQTQAGALAFPTGFGGKILAGVSVALIVGLIASRFKR